MLTLVEKGHVLKVSGDSTKVTRAVPRSALHAAHRPSGAELAAVLPPAGLRSAGGWGLIAQFPASLKASSPSGV
ncbi:hypothetical protein ACIOHS_15795 [Streptomyces sp. NPDC088253]|uniref:hypothetical protein n=1 Tax=Streptomyces sp. NPDC088253 TaxID=3365846 RepID=UPI0037F47E4F